MTTRAIHDCPVAACTRMVPSVDLLMCAQCWRRVPAELQAAVWHAWNRGLPPDLGALLDAQQAAIAAVDASDAARAARRAARGSAPESGVVRDAAGAIVRGPSLPCGCPLDSGCDGRHLWGTP